MPHTPIDILIVDDATIIIQQLSRLLSIHDAINSVHCAPTAEAGLKELYDKVPDILILDINLPGISGVEMLKKVRKDFKVRPLIIMLTNTPYAAYREECLAMGADFFLDKSRDFAALPGIVDDFINLKHISQ